MTTSDLRARAAATGGGVATRDDAPQSLAALIDRMKPEMSKALPGHLTPERFARLALTTLRRTPGLVRTTPESFLGAIMTCAQLGLEPGGPLNETYLVPYGKETQLIVGYQGLVKLFWQSPMAASIDSQVVYERDDFDYAYGSGAFLRHRPYRGPEGRGEVVAYWAQATLKNGAAPFVVLTPEECRDLRGGNTGPSGKIKDPQRWMERKTAIRQLVKMLPKSTELSAALEVDGGIRKDVSTTVDVAQVVIPVDDTPAIEAAPGVHRFVWDQQGGDYCTVCGFPADAETHVAAAEAAQA